MELQFNTAILQNWRGINKVIFPIVLNSKSTNKQYWENRIEMLSSKSIVKMHNKLGGFKLRHLISKQKFSFVYIWKI